MLLQIPESCRPNMEEGISLFSSLLNNKHFLIVFVHALEQQKDFAVRDRSGCEALGEGRGLLEATQPVLGLPGWIQGWASFQITMSLGQLASPQHQTLGAGALEALRPPHHSSPSWSACQDRARGHGGCCAW